MADLAALRSPELTNRHSIHPTTLGVGKAMVGWCRDMTGGIPGELTIQAYRGFYRKDARGPPVVGCRRMA